MTTARLVPAVWLPALAELLQTKPDTRVVSFADAIETSVRSNA